MECLIAQDAMTIAASSRGVMHTTNTAQRSYASPPVIAMMSVA
jgi:hypothetical protein